MKSHLYTLLFMLITSAICVGGVSTAYVLTKKQIRINEQIVKYKAVLYAADIAIPEKAEEVEKVYKENVKEIENNGNLSYYIIKGGKYALNATGTGLWGPIKGIICFDKSLKKMVGIAFTYQNETPGLGGRIEEKWFKQQFRGKIPPVSLAKDGKKADSHQFDAITGATISSKGVKGMINKAQENAEKIITSSANDSSENFKKH